MKDQTEQYPILKGIPLPSRGARRSGNKYRFADMAVGDSIVVPKAARNSAMSSSARYKPRVFTSAIHEKDPNLVRIWRLK